MDQIDAVEWGLKYLLTGPYLNELQKKGSGRSYKKSALNVLLAPGNCPGLKNCKWFSEDGADDPPSTSGGQYLDTWCDPGFQKLDHNGVGHYFALFFQSPSALLPTLKTPECRKKGRVG